LTSGYTFSEGSFGISGGATFTTGGTIQGTTATIPPGTTGTIAFSLVAQQEVTLAGTTYQLQPGTQINIQGTFVFGGVTFQSNPGTLDIPGNTSIEVTDTGATAGGTTGSVVFDNWPNTVGTPGTTYTPAFTNVSAYLSAGLTAGIGHVILVTGQDGITLNSDVIGLTLAFVSNNLYEIDANKRLTIGAGTTMIFPGFLTGITNCTISTTGNVILPTGTGLGVVERNFISYGATASPNPRQSSGYGGGGYTAGGEPARVTYVPGVTGSLLTPTNEPAGGGAGSWYIDVSATGTTYGGVGPLPYTNQYNRYGVYGAGGTAGGSGGSGYLVIEQVVTPTAPIPALTVHGALEVTGLIMSSGGISGTTASFSGGITANGGISGTTASMAEYYQNASNTPPSSLPTGYDTVPPVGSIMIYAGITSPPAGWLFCDGLTYDIGGTYARLFATILYTYGGSGSYFAVPNMGGRVPVGRGTATGATGATPKTQLGQTGGEETVSLDITQMPPHTHTVPWDTATAGNVTGVLENTISPRTADYIAGSIAGGSGGNVVAHNNMQPFLVMNYIIKF